MLEQSLALFFWSDPSLPALEEALLLAGRSMGSDRMSRSYIYARTVSRLQIDPGGPTQRLVDLLRSENPYKVAFAAQLLAERSTETLEVIPHLERCLEDARWKKPEAFSMEVQGHRTLVVEYPNWREAYYAAAEALARIAPVSPHAIAGHQIRLKREGNVDLEDRISSLSALGRMGSSAVDALPELLAAAQRKDLRFAGAAITALGMIGPAAKDAILTLEKLTEHEDRQIAERAKAALRQVRG